MTTYANLYPPIPILSFSYFVICASLESSKGAAKATAIQTARIINYFIKNNRSIIIKT